ncbi:hypothetical protein JMUB7530_28010 [Staphylococcus aureus]
MMAEPNFWDNQTKAQDIICLLYTSDAADELDGVDLGGRRIIKKTLFFFPPFNARSFS